MIVLDTTVLVYAKGADHELRDPCRRLIEAIADGRIAATTTVEAIQEFAHVRARRRGREDAAVLSRAYMDLLSPLLAVTEDDLGSGLEIFGRGGSPGASDCVLLAAAAAHGADAVVTADLGFREVDLIPCLHPADVL